MSRPGVHQGRIDADAAMAYALATNDPNDVYERGDTVPPLYTSAMVTPAFQTSEDPPVQDTIRGSRAGVHAEHDVRFHGPLRPGDLVRWVVGPHSVRQSPAGVLVTKRALVSDLEERPLVEHIWTSMLIGAVVDGPWGPDRDEHRFPLDARERPVGTTTFTITGDQSFRYAGASGDRNAHCVDDDAARAEGFPRKILQGLCTMAMCSGAVVAHAGGEPGRLRRLAVRFAAPLHLRQDLVVALFDAGATADGGAVLAFEATAGDAAIITHGRAELAPA